jgi:hypothetical protein
LVEGTVSLSGLDFTWGNEVASPRNFMTAKSSSFDIVDSHFELAPGQQIGIVVSRRSPVPHLAANVPNPVDLKRYYGSDLTSNIQTGTILAVSGDGSFFTHDINTYKGCSGAVVFLLDKKQPDSVNVLDYGKAIAVHGAPAAHDANVAFTICRTLLK